MVLLVKEQWCTHISALDVLHVQQALVAVSAVFTQCLGCSHRIEHKSWGIPVLVERGFCLIHAEGCK